MSFIIPDGRRCVIRIACPAGRWIRSWAAPARQGRRRGLREESNAVVAVLSLQNNARRCENIVLL